ncbi:hypothetical protein RI065_02530 [Mycoplasmatota bacterium zrk1]
MRTNLLLIVIICMLSACSYLEDESSVEIIKRSQNIVVTLVHKETYSEEEDIQYDLILEYIGKDDLKELEYGITRFIIESSEAGVNTYIMDKRWYNNKPFHDKVASLDQDNYYRTAIDCPFEVAQAEYEAAVTIEIVVNSEIESFSFYKIPLRVQ